MEIKKTMNLNKYEQDQSSQLRTALFLVIFFSKYLINYLQILYYYFGGLIYVIFSLISLFLLFIVIAITIYVTITSSLSFVTANPFSISMDYTVLSFLMLGYSTYLGLQNINQSKEEY